MPWRLLCEESEISKEFFFSSRWWAPALVRAWQLQWSVELQRTVRDLEPKESIFLIFFFWGLYASADTIFSFLLYLSLPLPSLPSKMRTRGEESVVYSHSLTQLHTAGRSSVWGSCAENLQVMSIYRPPGACACLPAKDPAVLPVRTRLHPACMFCQTLVCVTWCVCNCG